VDFQGLFGFVAISSVVSIERGPKVWDFDQEYKGSKEACYGRAG
jgi:hypothetical protein